MASKTLVVVLVAFGWLACGGKSKKEETVPTRPVVEEKVDEPTPPAKEPVAEEPAADPVAASLKATIYFEFDSSELSSDARDVLSNNAEWLKADGARRITIEGHTDEQGTTGYNIALGERRARQSQDFLVRLGIDKSRVRIISYGEEKPAGSDDSLNRRSMFVATKKK